MNQFIVKISVVFITTLFNFILSTFTIFTKPPLAIPVSYKTRGDFLRNATL